MKLKMMRTICLCQILKGNGVVLGGVQLDRSLGLELASHVCGCCLNERKRRGYCVISQSELLFPWNSPNGRQRIMQKS